jgi:type IV pilus assembly protein PilB
MADSESDAPAEAAAAVVADPLLQGLIENAFITPEQAAEAVEEQKRTGQPIRTVLMDLGMLTEDDLLVAIGNLMGATVVDLTGLEIPADAPTVVPASVARMYGVIPIEIQPDTATLAASNLIGPEVMDELRFVLTRDVSIVLAREDQIKTAIAAVYGEEDVSIAHMLDNLENEMKDGGLQLSEGTDGEEDIAKLANAAPVVRFVNLILFQAVQDGASDVHFEPFEKEFKIRYRVDGALYDLNPPPKSLALPVISRLKVMSNLNIAERRLPQDGRLQMNLANRTVDFRISTLPTQFGESVVLRILDRSTVSLDLENIGLPDDVYQAMCDDLDKPNGIVIVTGPTGSGKTTTLYSGIKRLNRIESKLLTVEDPVEYDIEGVVQVQVHEQIGVTFLRVLRAFLRQDPDIIMIGEIRDFETAQIAIQASLTGHLVLSTLHTNDAAGAVTRLIDMNVEPFLIASTLESVLAQRLVRRICNHCKQAYAPTPDVFERMNLAPDAVGDRPFYVGRGCSDCHQTGYRHRKGIFEYLPVSEPIRQLICDRRPTLEIRNMAVTQGMRTLREDGIRNVLDGHTTVDEVMRYT